MKRLTLLAVLLSGCNMAPKYVRPVAPVPSEFPTGPAYAEPVDTVAPELHWRDIFKDPALVQLVERSLATNRDLRIALGNIEAARAQYRIQRSDFFPDVGLTSGVTTNRNSSAGGSAAGGVITSGSGRRTVYTAGLALSGFEIDLFGRLRNLNAAAFDQYLATAAGARAARLAIVGGVAQAYFQLAADRSALAVAQQTVASAERSVRLTDQRRAGGIAPRTEVDQARTVLETARADVANFATAVAQDRNALELIVGAPVPDALLPASIEAVDGRIGEVPAGISSAVLLRRPDVVQAELRLKAANARIGVARAAFFPTISLTAALGYTSTALSALFDGDSWRWNAGSTLGLPLFDGGERSGNLALAKAQRDVAVATYERTIQVAFREAADALARRGTIDAQLAAVRANEAAAADNFRLADARYREGIDNFLASLDAQRTLYAAQQRLASARLLRANALVNLYQALGGDELTDPDRRALP